MTKVNETRLPRAKQLLDKVTGGKLLSNADFTFLNGAHGNYQANQAPIKRNSEYFRITSGFIDLYTEIIIGGLENEKSR